MIYRVLVFQAGKVVFSGDGAHMERANYRHNSEARLPPKPILHRLAGIRPPTSGSFERPTVRSPQADHAGTPSPVLTLRQLRLWHWREQVAARQNAVLCDKYMRPLEANLHKAQADFHLRAVACLNELVTGHVEEDDRG